MNKDKETTVVNTGIPSRKAFKFSLMLLQALNKGKGNEDEMNKLIQGALDGIERTSDIDFQEALKQGLPLIEGRNKEAFNHLTALGQLVEYLTTKVNDSISAMQDYVSANYPGLTKKEARQKALKILEELDLEEERATLGLSEEELEQMSLADFMALKLSSQEDSPDDNQRTHLPSNTLLNTSRLARSAFGKTPVDGQTYTLGNVGTIIRLDQHDKDLDIGGKLSPQDIVYHDAICSLLTHNKAITVGAVYRQVTGKEKHPTEQQEREIIEHIERLRGVTATVNLRNDKFFQKKQVEVQDINEPIYPFRRLRGKVNGQMTWYYSMIDKKAMPIIYRYAQYTGQLATYPVKLHDVPRLQNTQANMLIRRYILSQILYMKSQPKKREKTITIDKVLKEIGKGDANRVEKGRIVKACTLVLDHLVREEFIRGHEIKKKGNSYYAFSIRL